MFIDSDISGTGDDMTLPGHEAMMITNKNTEDAHSIINIYFEDKAPVKGLHMTIPAERVICTRMDLPICDEQFQIPFGQYSVELESDVPVCASYGRLDRRHNLGYYSTGYCAV
jgi:hypothetical protein